MKRLFLALWLIGLLSVTLVSQETERIFKNVLNSVQIQIPIPGSNDFAFETKCALIFGPNSGYRAVDTSNCRVADPESVRRANEEYNKYSFEVYTVFGTEKKIKEYTVAVENRAVAANTDLRTELVDTTFPKMKNDILESLSKEFSTLLQTHYDINFKDKFMETLKSEIKSEVERQKNEIRNALLNDPDFRKEFLEKLKEDLKGQK